MSGSLAFFTIIRRQAPFARWCLLGLLACIVLPGFATTYYVDGASGHDSNNGSFTAPWATMYQAGNTAVAGDTVIVMPGIYPCASNTPIVVANSGTAGSPITFKAHLFGSVIIQGPDRMFCAGNYPGANGGEGANSVKYVTVQGFIFNTSGTSTLQTGYPATIEGCSGWVLEDCVLPNYFSCGFVDRAYGSAAIKRCVFENGYGSAFSMCSNDERNPQVGITVADTSFRNPNKNNSVDNGTCKDLFTDHTLVDNVECLGPFSNFWFDTWNSHVFIRNSYFENGIEIEQNHGPLTIAANSFNNNYNARQQGTNGGAQCFESENITLSGNTFAMSNANYGVSYRKNSHPVAVNNLLISNNLFTVQPGTSGGTGYTIPMAHVFWADWVTPRDDGYWNAHNWVVDHNTYDPSISSNVSGAVFAGYSGMLYSTLASEQAYFGWDTHSQIANVPANMHGWLTGTTPSVGAGVPFTLTANGGHNSATVHLNLTGISSALLTVTASGVTAYGQLLVSINGATVMLPPDIVNSDVAAMTDTMAFSTALLVNGENTMTFVNARDSGAITVSAANITVKYPCGAGWRHRDIGAVADAGNAAYASANDTFTLGATGAGFTGTTDAGHYVYQALNGDGSITCRVVGLTNYSGSGSQAGVMIRNSLAATDMAACMVLTNNHRAVFCWRSSPNGDTTATAAPTVRAPYWVKLTRSGTTFTGSVSADALSWTQVGSATIAMGTQVYVGLALASDNNSTSSTAYAASIVDHVSIAAAGR